MSRNSTGCVNNPSTKTRFRIVEYRNNAKRTRRKTLKTKTELMHKGYLEIL